MIKLLFTLILRVKILFLLGFLIGIVPMSAQIFDQGRSHTAGPSEGAATCVRYGKGGKVMAAGTEKGKITVRYLNYVRQNLSRTIPKILRGHKGAITDIAFHDSNRYLVTASKDGTLKIWDLAEKKAVFTAIAKPRIAGSKIQPYFVFAHFSVVTPSTLFYGTSDGQLFQTNIFKGGVIASRNTQKEQLSSFSFAAEDRMVAMGSYNSVKILDWNSKKLEWEFKPCAARVISTDFSADNQKIACLCENGVMSIWDLELKKQLRSEKVNVNRGVTELDFSNDGRYLVVGSTKLSGAEPQLWDVPTLSLVGTLEGHTGSVLSLDFREDGRQIVTAGSDSQVMTWNYREVHEPELKDEPEDSTATEDPIVVIDPTPVTPPVEKKDVPTKEETLEELKLTYTHRNIPDSLGQRRVTTGKRSFVRREQIEIVIWDSEEIDGDTVSLYFNGEWLLKEYPLRKKKKKISVEVKRNADNYLILYAHNEGKRPPNTAALMIDDGGKVRKVGLSSDMKTCDAVKFEFLE